MKDGFIALIAVVLLATGTLAFSLVTLSAAASYSDMVFKHDERNQAHLNAESCLDSMVLMAAKDYFLSGQVSLKEFGCTAIVTNDSNGNIAIAVTAKVGDVGFQDLRLISI